LFRPPFTSLPSRPAKENQPVGDQKGGLTTFALKVIGNKFGESSLLSPARSTSGALLPRPAVAFYRDVLGLAIRFESAKSTEFETPGCTLALHLADVPGQTGSSPDASPAGVCHPGFAVGDLDAFHREMIATGVVCLQPPEGSKRGRS
jgi:hypothetical protein